MKHLIYIPIFLFCFFVKAQSNKVEWFLEISRQQAAPTAVYDGQNAADPINEVNATTGFTVDANATVSTSTSQVDNGTYSIHYTVSNTSGVDTDLRCEATGVSSGQNVTITYKVYRGQSGNSFNYFARLLTSEGDWSTSQQVIIGTGDTGTWKTVTMTSTALVDNPSIQVAQGSVSGVTDLYFDNMVITIN